MTTLPTATAPARAAGIPRLPLTPGRGLALLIGVPVAVFVIAITGFQFVSAIGKASFQVSRTLALPHGQFTLHTDGGDLNLQGTRGGGSAARLDGTVRYSLLRPKVIFDDGASGPGIRLGCPLATLANCEFNADVALPASTAVTGTTGGGNVTVSDVSGAVELETSGGDMRAVRLSGPVHLTSGGGNLSVEQVSGDTRLQTGGGDVTGTGITASTLTADTSGGNVGLTFTSPPKNLTVHTAGGDVTIIVPPGAYEVSTHTNGGDVNAFASTPGATYQITATSGGGNITIEQASTA